MDPVLYIIAAVLLAVLLIFASKIRGQTEQADREHQQNVAAAAARPRIQPEERGDGMPRRRMNRGMMAQRQARRMEEEREAMIDEDEGDDSQEVQAPGKIGAKKQKKLEEKQARKAQREAEEAERQERKKMEMQREEERRKEDERIRMEEQREEEEQKKAKEEQEKREYEEYLKLKESFVVEEEGVEETMDEEQDAINRIQDLLADGSITGVIDDRGKFIYITTEEMAAIAQFIRQRGRVSISELAQATNKLINLNPETNPVPLEVS
uniref:DDRGK domain-containing protein 1 n=1 Tax=Pyxicephalus adspersus TaxID=30357 RepID=A0AAV3B3W6_PYXAD|nr:TPA: hypothetical protein GDO54_009707 [Pyxicephalus adspersus]